MFIPQCEFPTENPYTLARTGYLTGSCESSIRSAISKYFEQQPQGEDVTLYVVNQMGDNAIENLAEIKDTTKDSVLVSLGIFIPMVANQMYPNLIETNRYESGLPKRHRTPKSSILASYTKHRMKFDD